MYIYMNRTAKSNKTSKMSPVTSFINPVSFHTITYSKSCWVPAEGQKLLWAACHSAMFRWNKCTTLVSCHNHSCQRAMAIGHVQDIPSNEELWALKLNYLAAAFRTTPVFGVNCLTSTNFVLHIAQLLRTLCKKAIQLTAKSKMRCEVTASVFDKGWMCDRTHGWSLGLYRLLFPQQAADIYCCDHTNVLPSL